VDKGSALYSTSAYAFVLAGNSNTPVEVLWVPSFRANAGKVRP